MGFFGFFEVVEVVCEDEWVFVWDEVFCSCVVCEDCAERALLCLLFFLLVDFFTTVFLCFGRVCSSSTDRVGCFGADPVELAAAATQGFSWCAALTDAVATPVVSAFFAEVGAVSITGFWFCSVVLAVVRHFCYVCFFDEVGSDRGVEYGGCVDRAVCVAVEVFDVYLHPWWLSVLMCLIWSLLYPGSCRRPSWCVSVSSREDGPGTLPFIKMYVALTSP